jgi:hypothetical protein
VVILQEFGVLRENRAFVGLVAIGFEGHQPFFSRAGKKLIEHFQRFLIFGFAVLRAAKNAEQTGNHFFHYGQGIGDEHGTERGAADNDDLGRLDKDLDRTVFHEKAAHDGPDDDNDSDDHEHGRRFLERRLAWRL